MCCCYYHYHAVSFKGPYYIRVKLKFGDNFCHPNDPLSSVCACVCVCACVRACVRVYVCVLHVPLDELYDALCRHEEDVSVGAFVERRSVTVYDLCDL